MSALSLFEKLDKEFNNLNQRKPMIEVKQEHFALDRAHLEEAILNQASLFDLYASECAKQQSVVDRLKNALEYKSAQLKIQIRTNAEAAKIKMVQDQVDCALTVEPEIKLLKEQILDAEEYLGQLKSAVEAMRHRRDSIENERALVLSKASMISCDCDPDTKLSAQCEAVDRATQESMRK